MVQYKFLEVVSSRAKNEIIELYTSQGWWSADSDKPDLVAAIVKGSHCFLAAIHDKRIIGMGRAISDRASDAYIQDVVVAECHKGKGIGKMIINKLVKRLNNEGIQWIGLIAEKNSHGFYEKFGFSKMPDSIPMLRAHADLREP